jgi:hypothetical protein
MNNIIRDEKTGRFLPGNPGSRAGGRPRGSRNRLSEKFLADFHAVWEDQGLEALQKVAESDPSTFVRVAASLLPRKLKLLHIELSDEQLEAHITQLAADLGLALGPAERVRGAADGAQAPVRPH